MIQEHYLMYDEFTMFNGNDQIIFSRPKTLSLNGEVKYLWTPKGVDRYRLPAVYGPHEETR